MSDKEAYKQKYQAQLDEWQADVDKLKAKAKGAAADVRLDMDKLATDLDERLHAASQKLAELSAASEGAWESLKKSVESAWDSLKQSVQEAVAKFKD